MDALADQIGRVRLGPVPLTFVFCVALVPLWTSFSSYDTSLLFSMFIIVTVIMKGSLLSCWILNRATSLILQVTSVLGVMVAQMFLLRASLDASLFSVIVLVPPSTFTGICICRSLLWGRGDDKQEDPVPGPRSRAVIGIFSRNSQAEYSWLTSMLSRVGRVVPFCITNSNAHQFTQQVPQCTGAILYHSKTRGRVNITDVVDSLYDEELSFMSKVLGKGNVIVVTDDMDDSSPSAAQRILTHQPAIAQLTSGVYLFTTKEKMDDQLIRDKVQPIINIFAKAIERHRGQDVTVAFNKKSIVSALHYLFHHNQGPNHGGSSSDIAADLVLIFLVAAPWLYFIFFIYNVFFLITTNLSGSFLLFYATHTPNHDARTVGLAAVLVLLVLELSSLYWVASSTILVLLIAQSFGIGVFFLTC